MTPTDKLPRIWIVKETTEYRAPRIGEYYYDCDGSITRARWNLRGDENYVILEVTALHELAELYEEATGQKCEIKARVEPT